MSELISKLFKRPIIVFLGGLTAILTFVGPFGTYEGLNFALRLAYWGPLVFGAYGFALLSEVVVSRVLPNAEPRSRQMVTVLVFALVFAPAVWVFSGLFAGDLGGMDTFLLIFANVLGVTAVVGFLAHFRSHMQEDAQSPLPVLYSRLPTETAAAVVRLTVDDHYVEVFLDDGSKHRLLMRFADAVSEMGDTPGFFTHRSHWVVQEYVQDIAREKNREYLMLNTGAKVPVSKTYRDNLEAAGFL